MSRVLLLNSSKPESFVYDQVGNRLQGPGAKDTNYNYAAGNEMIKGRKFSYNYDNNGNQVDRVLPGIAGKSYSQTWDYDNRLVLLTKVNGADSTTVSFTYDPQGRRIGKQLTTVFDGVTKTNNWRYVYDGDNIVFEVLTDSGGAVTKTFYTHGPGVDEHLALERNGQYFYYHSDGLGSTAAITDQNKSVVQNYTYGSFGMVSSSTSFVNSYTFTGREWDKETGLYYYRARYYDPMEGRFISKDPIGFNGGDVNLYGYVQNSPINWTDPSGLNPFTDAYCAFSPTIGAIADGACIAGGVLGQPEVAGPAASVSLVNTSVSMNVCKGSKASPSTITTVAGVMTKGKVGAVVSGVDLILSGSGH